MCYKHRLKFIKVSFLEEIKTELKVSNFLTLNELITCCQQTVNILKETIIMKGSAVTLIAT